jgi:peptidoglycan/LPS O-acetylase OafA/YrhL
MFHIHHSIKEILANVFFVFNFLPGRQAGIVWAGWTIGVEMVYYCLFPFFHRLSLRVKLVLLVGIGTLHCSLISVSGGGGFLRILFLGFIPIFLLGEITFQLVSAHHDNRNAKKWAPLATICGAAIFFWCTMSPDSGAPFQSGVTAELLRVVIGLAYSLLLYGLVLRPLWNIENRFLGFYGKISYSVYLCHPTIVYLLSRPFRWVYRVVPGSVAYLVCAGLTLAVVTGIATMTYRFIEKPSIQLGHKLLHFVISSRESRGALLSVR